MMVFGFGEEAAGGGNHVQAHVSLGPFPVVGPVRSEVEFESWKSVLRLVGMGTHWGFSMGVRGEIDRSRSAP